MWKSDDQDFVKNPTESIYFENEFGSILVISAAQNTWAQSTWWWCHWRPKIFKKQGLCIVNLTEYTSRDYINPKFSIAEQWSEETGEKIQHLQVQTQGIVKQHAIIMTD